jgi:filamentous hemagglutinin
LQQAAGGEGKILRVIPNEYDNLKVLEKSGTQTYYYHDVYTDGKYVYDPRLSSDPVPLGDWERMMRGMNPGGVNIGPPTPAFP